jgi:hypothetical protein
MNIVMNWHTHNVSDYSHLHKFAETATMLYEYSKTLKTFSDKILIERSHDNLGVHLINYGIAFNTGSLRESLSMQINKLNCLIRFSMIKNNDHYNNLSAVNKEIRCGFKRYKFFSKNNYFDMQKFMQHDFTSHIYSFLTDEDRTAIAIAKTYDPERTKKYLNKISLKHIVQTKYFTYSQYNILNECERLIKIESPRKSWHKKKILEQLEYIGWLMYHCYNMKPIELVPFLKKLNRYENLYIHNLFTKPYLIDTNYAKKFAHFQKALYIWGERNIDMKKKKTVKPKSIRKLTNPP